MTQFVCSQPSQFRNIYDGYTCLEWVEIVPQESLVQSLAITKAEADMISTEMLLVIFGAWTWKQVLLIIQRRRY